MKHILVPTDFSKNAWIATQYTLSLFHDTECVIYLLNTYTPAILNSRFMSDPIIAQDDANTSEASSKFGLSKIIEQLKSELLVPHHTFKTISSFSLLVDEVREVVHNFQIDYVVFGNKGVTDAKEVFMGSNAVKILKLGLSCPVLAIPSESKFKPQKKLALLTNLNWSNTSRQFSYILEMINRFQSKIEVFNYDLEPAEMTAVQQFNFKMLRTNLFDVPHSFHWIEGKKDLSQELEKFMSTEDIQLLVMTNCHYSLMERLTRDIVIKKIDFNSNVPVFIIPEMETDSSKQSCSRTALSLNN